MQKFKHIMRELQGAILVGSVFQIILGYTGLMSLFLRFVKKHTCLTLHLEYTSQKWHMFNS